jgi:GntR family transcriptional repressor for pyruvate dehydrogenase complex
VQSRQGSGWYVGKFDPVGSLKFLAPILETYTDTNAEIIIETRMAIEPIFARRAAEYITEEGLEKLETINEKMIESGEKKDFETFRDYDKTFHIILAQESHSGILCVLGTLLTNLFFSYWTPLCVDYDIPVRVHEVILEALRAGDSYRAEQCMKDHIETAREFLDKIRKHVEIME